MSMRAKLLAAAQAAATEATTNERARCLWCTEQVLKELKSKLDRKLLTTIQVHAVELKIRIAEAVSQELRRAIISGARPVSNRSEPGAVDLSSSE